MVLSCFGKQAVSAGGSGEKKGQPEKKRYAAFSGFFMPIRLLLEEVESLFCKTVCRQEIALCHLVHKLAHRPV
jgi:hypothetical protein